MVSHLVKSEINSLSNFMLQQLSLKVIFLTKKEYFEEKKL